MNWYVGIRDDQLFFKKNFFDLFYTTREKQKSEKNYILVDNFTDLDF